MYSSLSICLIVAACFFCSCADPATDPGSEPETSDQLIPLTIGNTWAYRDLESGSTSPDDPFIVRSIVNYVVAEISPYEWPKSQCSGHISVYVDERGRVFGVALEAVYMGGARRGNTAALTHGVPKHPTAGMRFGNAAVLVYQGTETVTTPAGTFACYRFELEGSRKHYWWARGVGLVQMKSDSDEGVAPQHWVLERYQVGH